MKDTFPHYTIGHFINQPGSLTDFEILRFDNMEEPDVDDYHKHTFYEILWTEKGESKQIIDYNEFEVKPNTLFFISPHQVHYFEEWRSLEGGTILFTEDFYLLNRTNKNMLFEMSFLDNLYSNPCIEFSQNDFEEVLHIIGKIEQEQQHVNKNPSIIQAYLHILLSQVQRHVNTNDAKLRTKKFMVQFKQFKRKLEEHFTENKTAGFYAGELNITPHHLNIICKEIADTTVTNIIRARSILEAKRLLTFTNKTISEIAFELNFTDSSYFAKTFRLHTKQTPQDFRNLMSEKYRTR